MKVRTVKDVDDKTWHIFKDMARRRKVRMGSLLKQIATEYSKKPSDSWEKILRSKPMITGKEAEAMSAVVASIRKEAGYRDVSDT